MNPIPEWMWEVWQSGRFIGENRPVTRATISRNVLTKVENYRTLLFTKATENQIEIPNISSVQIDRRLNADAATMTMTLKNFTAVHPSDNLDQRHNAPAPPTGPGRTRRELRELGKPGFYTFRRGVARDIDGVNPWDHDSSRWVDLLIPNRVIWTFQGYGSDGALLPSQDSRLVLTGVWLIDRVEFRADGDIVITARDLAKLLIEQRLYPPIIPLNKYPLEFCADGEVLKPLPGPNIVRPYTSPAGLQTSTQYRVGVGGTIHGHRYADAFDGNPSTYWLSGGYPSHDRDDAYEWIQFGVGYDWASRRQPVKRIRWYQKLTNIYSGGYIVYVSLYGRPYVEGAAPPKPGEMRWLGDKTIPYVASDQFPDNGADIPYVVKKGSTTYHEGYQVIELDQRYEVEAIRLTFTELNLTSYGDEENVGWRVAVADIQVFDVFDQPVPVEGNIDDYTDIVKLLCAWSGFYWPNTSRPDPLLTSWSEGAARGRVWGDFFHSGAYPVDPYCIPPSFWDNKSVMDGINQVKEILGFIFVVDSAGGIQWRPPNIWRTGNYIRGVGYVGDYSVRTVSEENVLLDYGVTVDDTNLRSDIIVVSADDPSLARAYRPGFAIGESEPGTEISDLALVGGQERVMLISNYPFGKADDPDARAQIDKFAYLLSLWIHWSYRKSRFRIPGNPAFEVDDQVRITERMTSEVYVHYIEGYRSQMDLEAGTWYMDIDTHWLGNGPDREWLMNYSDMHPALFAYLHSIGQIPDEEGGGGQLNWPEGWENFVLPDSNLDDVPRLDEDLKSLFPDPPPLVWPSIDWASEFEIGGVQGGSAPSGGGAPSGGSAFNCSESAKRSYWGPPPPNGREQTRINFLGKPVQVHRLTVAAWERLAEIFEDEGWFPTQVGGYSYRRIVRADGSTSNTWSNHAWGHAVDFDWSVLPQGRKAPAGHVSYRVAQRATALRTNSGKKIFRWGGNWSGSTADPMHFEICCTPDDLASGIFSGGGGPPVFVPE